jgi:hypothetical protein
MVTAAPALAEDTPRIRLRGLLDLALHNDTHAASIATFDGVDSPLQSQRLRLFVEGSASPTIDVFTQVILAQGTIALEGAYALVTPWRERDLHLMAGKIPWPIGTWAPRTYSNENPFVTSPLMYQHHTSLAWDQVPPSPAALLSAAGTGWEGADYGGGAGAVGMPIVDDYGWDFGIVALGSVGRLEFSGGLTNSAPGWSSPGEDANGGKAVMGRLGIVPTVGLRLGVSAAQGAYLGEWVAYALPAGKKETDYMQTLGMADVSFERGRVELRAEGFVNEWETAYCGTLRSTGGYAEGRFGFESGVWLAARAEALRFSELTDGSLTRPWDDEVGRLDVCVGYRIARGAAIKSDWQRARLRRIDGTQTSDLFVSQLSLEF